MDECPKDGRRYRLVEESAFTWLVLCQGLAFAGLVMVVVGLIVVMALLTRYFPPGCPPHPFS